MRHSLRYLFLLVFLWITAACGPTSTPSIAPTSPGYPGGATPFPTQSLTDGYPAATSHAPTSALPSGYPGAVVVVTYQDFAIVPAALSIPAGTTIQFVMESASGAFHRPINSTEPNVFQAPDQLGNGATYNQIFSQPGTVTLLCAYHPEMKATLTVTP